VDSSQHSQVSTKPGQLQIAHHDVTKPKKLPTFGEVEKVISYLEELIQHYSQLLEATYVAMDLNFQYDWRAIFRVRWIP
jgi:hypothetical protein